MSDHGAASARPGHASPDFPAEPPRTRPIHVLAASCKGAKASPADDPILEVAAGAVGPAQLAMSENATVAEVVVGYGASDCFQQAIVLRPRRYLLVEIAQHHDAEVVLVLVTHVGPLVAKTSPFPEATFAVDHDVVADVPEASPKVRFADTFHSIRCGGEVGEINGIDMAFVVDR